MELLQLKYFKDAAELENFSNAAKKNMVPQPSISYAIKKLEEELGVRLFDRTGRNIVLNENGTYFYKQVSTILNTVDECKIHFSNVTQNEITIYIQDGDFFISPLTADFCFKYTHTHFKYATVEEVMHSEKVPYDFTFMQSICDLDDFNYEVLLEDEFVAIVPVNHPLSKKDEISLSELKNENFVGLYDTIPIRVMVDKYCMNTAGFTPNYVFKFHEDFATIHRVSQNGGVAILTKKYYMMHPNNNVKMLSIKEKDTSKLLLAWPKDKILTPWEKEFLDFSKTWFKNL